MSAAGAICVGDVEVRAHEHAVLVHGDEVPLSSREFAIVRTLAEHPGWVFSATQLSGDPEEGEYSPESVSVLVSRLRHKLAEAGAPDVVETVRGVGYRLHGARVPFEESSEAVAASRELRDAAWRLQEAVIEVEHSGNLEQQQAAAGLLERARRGIFASLAE
jgi:DNA-binding winged helix-turn-helix (wHTH) protein